MGRVASSGQRMSSWLLLTILLLLLSTLLASNDSYQSEASELQWTHLQVKFGPRTVLDVGPGSIAGGRLLGILGPSGCGKSTLLNALGAEGRGDMGAGSAGGVGCSEGSRQLPSSEVALVHQQDAFFPMLTVGETLVLAAQLRQVAQKGERVRAVVRALGLQDVLHSSGGDADDPRHQTAWRGGRGISGGERKRLAVACAMLGSPSLLIADEPTSGLDSFQALQIARLLHDLARREGIIVLCSMHQPRSSIWALFDDVMLLTPHGRVAYHGPQTAAIGYFASLGHPCPPHTNPAEHLIDLVSLD
ncbi:P-loop containing nucleoside triphosphate hydrolase protein, partial [Ochromonadaceae sp. CCMP2298]